MVVALPPALALGSLHTVDQDLHLGIPKALGMMCGNGRTGGFPGAPARTVLHS